MSDFGYPGNGEYPKTYMPVVVKVQSRGYVKANVDGLAYWSGNRWIGVEGFKIGYGKVIKWRSE